MNSGHKPNVSVLMPVYNPDLGFLDKAIQSILEQDYTDFELVIVEEASPRIGREVVEGLRDPRVVYVLNKRRTSFAEQLNLCLKICKGEYVARMDGDDLSEPNRLSFQLRFMRRHPEISVVGTNLRIISESGRIIGSRIYPETSEDIALQMRRMNAVAHPSVMFRKKAVVEMGGFQVGFGPVADYDLWCRMLLEGKAFYNIQEPLVRYRIHSQASKVVSLKKTLRATIEIKRRCFKGKRGLWGPKEAVRYTLEQILLYMPDPMVLRIFLALTMKK